MQIFVNSAYKIFEYNLCVFTGFIHFLRNDRLGQWALNHCNNSPFSHYEKDVSLSW
ncbi:MAG: hypothetical protein IJD28_07115 [Deferribacterales bacterium]|nr:hypothetical protein [Deferribacterales bacterium]